MSTSNSTLAPEFATLMLQLGFSQAVIDFLSDEQGINMVKDFKIIPTAQMPNTHTTLSTAAAAFNIHKIQTAKTTVTVTTTSGGSTQTTGASVSPTDMVVFPMSPWTKLCGFRAWMDYRDLREESLDPQKFVGDLIDDWLDRFNFLKSEVDSKVKPPDAPKLTSIAGWEAFQDAFDLNMSYYRMVIGGNPVKLLTLWPWSGHGGVVVGKVCQHRYGLVRNRCPQGRGVPRSKQVALSVVETADWGFDTPFNPKIPEHHGWPFGIRGN
jgi:hypothetical protein